MKASCFSFRAEFFEPFESHAIFGNRDLGWRSDAGSGDFSALSEDHTTGSSAAIRMDGRGVINSAHDPALIDPARKQLIGEDPFDTERHAARLSYYASGASYRGGPSVDVALWDLVGKACGQPLEKLFGGAKDRVLPYASMVARYTGRAFPAGGAAFTVRLEGDQVASAS